MNLEAIKKELNKQSESTFQKIDYSKIKHSLPQKSGAKYTMRIVPLKHFQTEGFPFIKTYQVPFNISNKKVKGYVYSLLTWGEKCPFDEASKELKKDWKKNQNLIKTLRLREEYYIPVLIRELKDQGVKLLKISKKNYDSLIQTANDEDYRDYDDIKKGRDFNVIITIGNMNGVSFNEYNFTPKPNNSPLSTDKKEEKEWLENQPNLIESFKKYDYDELKDIIQFYINELKDAKEDSKENNEENIPQQVSKQSTQQSKTKVVQQVTQEDDDLNDLPF